MCELAPAPHRTIWMVPTEAFQRTHYPLRGAWIQEPLRDCRDPEQAFQNWMDRDVAFARQVAAEAAARGRRVLTVDGSQSIADNAAIVERHFRLVHD